MRLRWPGYEAEGGLGVKLRWPGCEAEGGLGVS